jgi:chromosome segregation ATPase
MKEELTKEEIVNKIDELNDEIESLEWDISDLEDKVEELEYQLKEINSNEKFDIFCEDSEMFISADENVIDSSQYDYYVQVIRGTISNDNDSERKLNTIKILNYALRNKLRSSLENEEYYFLIPLYAKLVEKE